MSEYERVLLLSGAAEWREALEIELHWAGHEASHSESAKGVARHVQSFRPTIAAIHVDTPLGEAPDVSAAGAVRIASCSQLADKLRRPGKPLPIVFFCSVPDDRLAAAAHLYEPSEVLVHQQLDAAKLAEAIVAAGHRMRRSNNDDGPLPTSATIEITLNATTIGYEAHVGSQTKPVDPAPWTDSREIRLIDTEFRNYEADPPSFQKVWPNVISSTSRRLGWYLFDSRLEDLRKFCRDNIAPGGTIRYRFIVPSDDMEHVPFELVSTGNEDEYMREVTPIARKMLVLEQHKDPDRQLRARRHDGRPILFLNAAVQGVLLVEGHTFKGSPEAVLGQLNHLGTELEKLIEVHGKDRVKQVNLIAERDPLKTMIEALDDGPYDVIHFAGHSVRSDVGGQVFLALPGPLPRIQPYSVDDFARRSADADARLVVLSSCESCSCRTLLRMAAFGVPAVAGFRWPVDDRDAAVFAPALHHELFNKHQPIICAFHAALMTLKEKSPGRITRFSPILMLQNAKWQDYRMEGSP